MKLLINLFDAEKFALLIRAGENNGDKNYLQPEHAQCPTVVDHSYIKIQLKMTCQL